MIDDYYAIGSTTVIGNFAIVGFPLVLTSRFNRVVRLRLRLWESKCLEAANFTDDEARGSPTRKGQRDSRKARAGRLSSASAMQDTRRLQSLQPRDVRLLLRRILLHDKKKPRGLLYSAGGDADTNVVGACSVIRSSRRQLATERGFDHDPALLHTPLRNFLMVDQDLIAVESDV